MEASGPAAAVDEFAAAHQALHREQLGGAVRASLRGSFDDAERTRAKKLGIDLAPVSLQQAVVRLTTERTNAR